MLIHPAAGPTFDSFFHPLQPVPAQVDLRPDYKKRRERDRLIEGLRRQFAASGSPQQRGRFASPNLTEWTNRGELPLSEPCALITCLWHPRMTLHAGREAVHALCDIVHLHAGSTFVPPTLIWSLGLERDLVAVGKEAGLTTRAAGAVAEAARRGSVPCNPGIVLSQVCLPRLFIRHSHC